MNVKIGDDIVTTKDIEITARKQRPNGQTWETIVETVIPKGSVFPVANIHIPTNHVEVVYAEKKATYVYPNECLPLTGLDEVTRNIIVERAKAGLYA